MPSDITRIILKYTESNFYVDAIRKYYHRYVVSCINLSSQTKLKYTRQFVFNLNAELQNFRRYEMVKKDKIWQIDLVFHIVYEKLWWINKYNPDLIQTINTKLKDFYVEGMTNAAVYYYAFFKKSMGRIY